MKISNRYATAIINSMSAGVVPHIGLSYIAVGRKLETEAILSDLNAIADGGGAFRFIIGEYGSGKSFMLQLTRNNALERNYIVADADLTPDRRLTGAKGQGLRLYRELMSNLSTKARPEGNAVETLLTRWISDIQTKVEKNGIAEENPYFFDAMEKEFKSLADEMREYVYGYELSLVLKKYWQGYRENNEDLKNAALRWLRGEYERKLDARMQLGVDRIITDEDWYDFIKLIARMVVKLGYKGLLVLLDEEVNLYKINNAVSRNNNYEKLLSMFNDIMQGRSEYLGVFFGGTIKSVEDDKRGLFSYEALRSRLKTSRYVAQDGLIDFSGPIIKLKTLSPEEIYVLLENLQGVFCAFHKIPTCLNQDQMMDFMEQVSSRLGADQLLTPREVTRDFIAILNLLRQNPDQTYEGLTAAGRIQLNPATSNPEDLNNGKYAEFDL